MVERIRELLKARQLSPTQFADTIGVGRPVVSHILSGRNKPSLEVVQKIIASFPDLALPWLLNGEGAMWASATPAPTTTIEAPLEAGNLPATERTRKKASVPSQQTAPKPQPAKEITPEAPLAATPPVSSPAPPALADLPPAATSPLSLGALLNPDKEIRRIVIFYRDGTFADYQPES